jgi:hypothetical protein
MWSPLEHELGVQVDDLAVHSLPGLGEERGRLGLGELHAHFGDDPPPALVEYPDRVLRQDLVARHSIDKHTHIVELSLIKWKWPNEDGGSTE